jgi:phytoene/squalene synthetase
MRDASTTLARTITKASSKQSYYTAVLLADRELVDDCCRAYAYFRWADDVVDASSQSREQRVSFMQRQRELIDRLYKGEQPDGLAPEEALIADLIRHDGGESPGLESFIRNFAAVLDFDAQRRGFTISQAELSWYSSCLGKAVTDCIQHFIGNGHVYPASDDRYLAATAAHITHMLRDMVDDIPEGFINLPCELMEEYGIDPSAVDVGSLPVRAWVRSQVRLARRYFDAGKRYLDELDVLRCKIAGYWYCARFEGVLDAIKRNGYVLRPVYNERRRPSTWFKMGWLSLMVPLQHVLQRGSSMLDRRVIANHRRAQRNP